MTYFSPRFPSRTCRHVYLAWSPKSETPSRKLSFFLPVGQNTAISWDRKTTYVIRYRKKNPSKMTSRKTTLLLCVLFACASLAGASLPRQVRTARSVTPQWKKNYKLQMKGNFRRPQALLLATACTIGNIFFFLDLFSLKKMCRSASAPSSSAPPPWPT